MRLECRPTAAASICARIAVHMHMSRQIGLELSSVPTDVATQHVDQFPFHVACRRSGNLAFLVTATTGLEVCTNARRRVAQTLIQLVLSRTVPIVILQIRLAETHEHETEQNMFAKHWSPVIVFATAAWRPHIGVLFYFHKVFVRHSLDTEDQRRVGTLNMCNHEFVLPRPVKPQLVPCLHLHMRECAATDPTHVAWYAQACVKR